MEHKLAQGAKRRLKLTADGVQNLTILSIFLFVCLVGYLREPTLFLTKTNILNIFVSSSSIIIVASAVTLVLITGNLNLSVGGIGAMSAVIFSLLTRGGMDIMLALFVSVLIGGLAGFLCGYSIAAMMLPSFIISLAFKYICRGIALIGAKGAVVFGLPYQVSKIGGTVAGIPLPMIYALIIVGIFMFIQGKTVFGSKCYAIGSNIQAAKLSGLDERRVITGVFVLSSLVAAFAGIVLTARVTAGDSGIFPSLESDCIIAAVLGGTDINGGRGTVFGMLIGALFITVLTNIMNMQGLTIYIQSVVKGIVLIFAILMNIVIRNRVRV